jgi:hypothetical protein
MDLERNLVKWLDHPDEAMKMGKSAETILKLNQGALSRLSSRISTFL